MKAETFEETFARKLRESVAGKCLPGDFADRLALSMRRSAVRARVRVAVYAALAAVLAFAVAFAGCRDDVSADQSPAIADTGSSPARSVVGEWILFGCVREWCKRARSARKKKDENCGDDTAD